MREPGVNAISWVSLPIGSNTWVTSDVPEGLDIVPLHPDLHQLGSIDLAQRITWTQGNL